MIFKRFLFVIAIVTAIMSAYYAVYLVEDCFVFPFSCIIKKDYFIENRDENDLFVKGNSDAPWISVPSQTSASLEVKFNIHLLNDTHDLWIKRNDGRETKLAYYGSELRRTFYEEDTVRAFNFVQSKFHVILKDNHVYLQGKYEECSRRDFDDYIKSSATVGRTSKPLHRLQTLEITNIDTPTLTGGLCLPAVRYY